MAKATFAAGCFCSSAPIRLWATVALIQSNATLESEADRAARLDQINVLTALLSIGGRS